MRRTLVIGLAGLLALFAAGVALADEHAEPEAEETAGMPPFLTGDKEVPPGLAEKDPLPPGLAKKLGDNTPPGQAKKSGDWSPPGLEMKGADWLPKGLEQQGKIPPGHAKRLGVDPVGVGGPGD